jgi:homoserine kinase
MARRLVVRVPASSANLGPGFDTFAAAIGMHLEVEVTETGSFALDTDLDVARDRRNLVVRAFAELLEPDAFAFRIRSDIPLSGGLGSSAAAHVAGLVAAAELTGADHDLLQHATALEGHPDNAAAALLGGFVVAARDGAEITALRFDPPRDLRAVLFIPELRLSTPDMRKALPDSIPIDDVVANLGAVALGVAGLAAGQTDLLRHLTVDRIHEPYRASVYPQLPRLVAAAREAGALGACLSGAGSTILAFADSMADITRIEAALLAVAADTDLPGRVLVVEPRREGAKVIQTD